MQLGLGRQTTCVKPLLGSVWITRALGLFIIRSQLSHPRLIKHPEAFVFAGIMKDSD